MSKDDFDDDYDFDADFGMDDIDGPDEFSAEPDAGNAGDRSAVSQIADGAFRTAISVNSARAAAKAIKENALPPGYRAAIDTADGVLTEGRKLYDSAVNELKPATESVKTLIRNNQDKVDRFLPEAVAKKVKDLVKEKFVGDHVDPTEASIQGTLREVFGEQKQGEDSAAAAEYDVARDKVNDARAKLQHGESMGAMGEPLPRHRSFGRLSGYHLG